MINAPFYDTYIDPVRNTDIVPFLEDQMNSTNDLLSGISDKMGNYSYAEGKWTIKELIGHLIDSERVFAYRASRIARKDKTALAGFDQDEYIKYSNFNSRSVADLAEELYNLRKANLLMFRNMTDEMLTQTGVANDSEISADAFMYIIAGHAQHHINVIKEKYLVD